MGKLGSIPQPPGYPFLGNLFDIDMELPLKSLYDLAEKHGQWSACNAIQCERHLTMCEGELYRMKFPGHTFLIANSYAMVNEFCNESRFPKTVFALQVCSKACWSSRVLSSHVLEGDEACNARWTVHRDGS